MPSDEKLTGQDDPDLYADVNIRIHGEGGQMFHIDSMDPSGSRNFEDVKIWLKEVILQTNQNHHNLSLFKFSGAQ